MKKLFLAAAVMLASSSAYAQEAEKFSPYGFVQLQGGVSTTFTNVNQKEILSPTMTLNVGAMVIPQLGLRMGVNGWKEKGALRSLDNSAYSYNYINADVDLLFNVLNLFRKKTVNNAFDLSLVAGIGINHAWNNNINTLPLEQASENLSNIWGNDLAQTTYHGTSFRMGMLADFRLNKNWSLGAEVDMNAMGDDWNAKYQQDKRDWQLTAQISLTYKFGGKKKARKSTYTTVDAPVTTSSNYASDENDATLATAAGKAVKAEESQVKDEVRTRKPAEDAPQAIKAEPVDETIFYRINETENTDSKELGKIVEWCKKHPGQKIHVDGYADKGTGTPAVNMRCSQRRVNKVVTSLKAAGISESQIVAKAWGDTVQPFKDNDQNRCVIITSK